MSIENKQNFIAEYSQLLQSKSYEELLEKYRKEIKRRHDEVFDLYTSMQGGHYVENQIYNEKNVAVEVLSILLTARDDFKALDLIGTKYIIKELEDRIEGHTKMIKESIGGLNTGLTMSVYTETDVLLRGVTAYQSILDYYEIELENCKKQDNNDSTLEDVKEEV